MNFFRVRQGNGHWNFLVRADGSLLEGEKSIVTDAFAIMGLTEYFLLTAERGALEIAKETYRTVCARLERPGTYPTAPYPTPPGMLAHREFMQFHRVPGAPAQKILLRVTPPAVLRLRPGPTRKNRKNRLKRKPKQNRTVITH